MTNLFSFDIFDTCLVRTCGRPINVLYALAYKVLGVGADFDDIRDFVRKRQEVEREICREGIDAPTIDQIYEKFDVSYYTDVSSERIREMELELEDNILVPVESVVDIIRKCREKGRVVFISDMYLPSCFLRSIMSKYGIIKENENIYVSCEYQATKRSGKLFDIVREKEHILYNKWTHFGDDYYNDYLVPKQKGIKTKRVNNGFSEFEELADELSPFTSDKFSFSIFAGILRATRLSLGIVDDGGLLSDVMCGLFLPFVGACLIDAQKRRIKRLYFASRDAYVMFIIAKQLSPIFPDIELRYLYISTRVLYPTIIKDGTQDELRKILINIPFFKPQSILTLLGLENELNYVSSQMDIESVCSNDSDKAEHLVKLLTTTYLREIMRKNCQINRELLVDYLRQEKFVSDDGKVNALVDIGWRCTSQFFLNNLIGRTVFYYYFGVVGNNLFANEIGNYKAYFYTDIAKTIHPKILESYFCKNRENTVIGYVKYKNKIEVKYANKKVKNSVINDFERREYILKAITHMYAEYDFLFYHSEEIFYNYSCRLIKLVLDYPSKKAAQFLSDKMMWDSYVDEHKVIRKIYIHKYVFHRLFYPKKHRKQFQYLNLWLTACISYTYGRWAISPIKTVGRILRKIKQRVILYA